MAHDAFSRLKGLRFGHDLLKQMPFLSAVRSLPSVAPAIAEAGFRSLAKRFGASPPAIAAAQRDWRGFRIATWSRERDDATLPKIWTRSAWSQSREQEPWRLR